MRRVHGWIYTIWQYLVMASVIIISLSLGVWWFDTAPPLTVISAEPRKAALKRGELLIIDYKVNRHRLCHGEVQRIVVDSQDVLQIIEPYSFSHTSDDGTGRLGLTRISVTVAVPTGAAIGPARYQAILTYQCNPLQRALGHAIEVRSPSVFFEIMPDAGPAIYRGPAQDPDVIPPSNRRDAQIRPPVFLSALAPATSLRADCFANACPLGMVRVRTHFRRADGRLMRVREHCRSPPTSRY